MVRSLRDCMLTLCVLVATTSCATPRQVTDLNKRLRFYAPPPVIIPGRASGRFAVVNGCIVFNHQAGPVRTDAALFPIGTTVRQGDSVLIMPNGDRLRIGEPVTIVANKPSTPVNIDTVCDPTPIQVLRIVKE